MSTEEKWALKILQDVGAIITDSHIVYASGKHGKAYVNKDAVYPYTGITSVLCRAIAKHFVEDHIEVVIAPAVGGVILSQWVADHLTKLTSNCVLSLYAEKLEIPGSGWWYLSRGLRILLGSWLTQKGRAPVDKFVIKRGYEKLIRNKRLLALEDILNTGGSAKKVIETAREAGGNVIGLAALCNRGGVIAADVGNPPKLFSLANITMDTWDEDNCPLCSSGVPINTSVGHGKQFLMKRGLLAS